MANIGEAQITRLGRERLAAIKKFLPVRDSFRDNLQVRQKEKMDFATGAEQLFKPITMVTEKVVTAIEGYFEKTYDEKVQELRNRFTDDFLTTIDKIRSDDLVKFTATGFYDRYNYLQPNLKKSFIGSFDKWIDAVYKVKAGKNQLDNIVYDRYVAFNTAVKIKNVENKEKTKQIKEVQQKRVPIWRRGRQK